MATPKDRKTADELVDLLDHANESVRKYAAEGIRSAGFSANRGADGKYSLSELADKPEGEQDAETGLTKPEAPAPVRDGPLSLRGATPVGRARKENDASTNFADMFDGLGFYPSARNRERLSDAAANAIRAQLAPGATVPQAPNLGEALNHFFNFYGNPTTVATAPTSRSAPAAPVSPSVSTAPPQQPSGLLQPPVLGPRPPLASASNPARPAKPPVQSRSLSPISAGDVVPSGSQLFSGSAPVLDDRSDSGGRTVPGAQSFVSGLFGAADTARKALQGYKKDHPEATSAGDAQLAGLESANARALNQANAGSQWAAMTPSARQAANSARERAQVFQNAQRNTQAFAAEQRQAAKDAVYPTGAPRPTNLLEDLAYQNSNGVLRDGAGIGTSVTAGGGVIGPNRSGPGRTLVSPYGTGSAVTLTPEQQAKRPEAMIEGVPASQFFDAASRRQGQTFNVGGVRYSPDNYPAPVPGAPPDEYAQRQLEAAGRRADEERKKFAKTMLNAR